MNRTSLIDDLFPLLDAPAARTRGIVMQPQSSESGIASALFLQEELEASNEVAGDRDAL